MYPVRTLVLFVLLGAAATVALCWAFALMGTVTLKQFTASGGAWPVRVPNDWPLEAIGTQRMTGRGLVIDRASAVDKARRQFEVLSIRFGWPCPAMEYRWQTNSTENTVANDSSPSIAAPNWLDDFIAGFKTDFPAKRRLPLALLFPGFVLDTMLYAAGFWGILRLRRTVRTLLRTRRQQCVACGYPAGTSEVCTECGAPVRQKATTIAKTVAPLVECPRKQGLYGFAGLRH